MLDPEQTQLRILVANEQDVRLDMVTTFLRLHGYEVIATSIDVDAVAALSRDAHADVALVGLGLDSDHALQMITNIVREAACPVIALLDASDQTYVNEAAKRGVFAYVVLNDDPQELQNALDITLRRFAEFQNLQGAFGRRAIIEQAKGILMERHAITADDAYALLRKQSQTTGRKLQEIAEAITQTHTLLPRTTTPPEQTTP